VPLLLRHLLIAVLAIAASCSSNRRDTDNSAQPERGSAGTEPTLERDDRYDDASLGALSFELSEGNAKSRAHFRRGLLALHSFWYDEAARQFAAAMAADPAMNMPYWGAAMSHLKLLWGEDDLDAAKQVLSRMPDPERLSEREQAWVMATVVLLRAPDVRTSRKQYASVMEEIHKRYPDDEAATFLAVALLSTTRPEDPDTLAVRERAAALAKAVYEGNPNHPGAAHYMIHAYDVPELAAKALPLAHTYAKIAPEAFHARHMPSHIFSRLGMWKEALASCRSAWDASLAAARREKLSANHHDFHSLSWIVEMSFELGHRKAADAALEMFAAAVRAGLDRRHRTAYAVQVESYMMRTGDWPRVDELLEPLAAAPADEEPAGAATRSDPNHCAPNAATSGAELAEQIAALYARARASAMQKDAASTRKYLGQIDQLRAKLRPILKTSQPEQVLAQTDEAHARRRELLLARATGNDHALVAMLRKLAATANVETGGESNPSGFVAEEELGDVLLRLGRHAEATSAYNKALAQHPGRARSLLGAARAAAAMGERETARARYRELAELWTEADDGFDGLADVRAASI
jgi:tetratricopeptide (TPR) repeat protein